LYASFNFADQESNAMNIEIFYNRPAETGEITLHDLTQDQMNIISGFAHAVMLGKQTDAPVKQAQFAAARVFLGAIRESIELCKLDNVWAIKAVRTVTNLRVKDAKAMVDLYLPNTFLRANRVTVDQIALQK
jgi:hypothetical protein